MGGILAGARGGRCVALHACVCNCVTAHHEKGLQPGGSPVEHHGGQATLDAVQNLRAAKRALLKMPPRGLAGRPSGLLNSPPPPSSLGSRASPPAGQPRCLGLTSPAVRVAGNVSGRRTGREFEVDAVGAEGSLRHTCPGGSGLTRAWVKTIGSWFAREWRSGEDSAARSRSDESHQQPGVARGHSTSI